MFAKTRLSIKETVRDIKRAYFVFSTVTQIWLLFGPLYLLLAGRGHAALNIVMLALGVLTLAAHLIYEHSDKEKADKRKYKKVKKVSRRVRFAVKTLNLLSAIYAVCVTYSDPDVFAILVTLGMIIMWIIDFAFLLVTLVFDYFKNKIERAFSEDVDEIKDGISSPIRAAKRLLRKDKEIEENDYIIR